MAKPRSWLWPTRIRKRDRKSTRLNSSHSQMSYAVFCLKKKIARECNKGRRAGSPEFRTMRRANNCHLDDGTGADLSALMLFLKPVLRISEHDDAHVTAT